MTWDHGKSLAQDPSIDELQRSIPTKLYKFSGLANERLGRIKRLIVESELYFARPSSFNDPLDCRLTASFEAAADVIQEHWENIGARHFSHVAPSARDARVRELITQSVTPEGQAEFAQKLIEILDRNGAVCFATRPNNMLLWSYYAESHRGIAVEFGFDTNRFTAFCDALEAQGTNPPFPIRVTYADDVPSINYYTASTHDRLRGLLGTKAKVWEHEQEWRFSLADRSGPFRIPPELVTAVIFGLRTSREHEETIRRWVGERQPAVELRRVVHRPNSFDLEVVPA